MSGKEQFIKQHRQLAEDVGRKIGVDPSILLGQWALESGWGASTVKGTNNLGNIKDFSGSGIQAKDNMLGTYDKYRSYNTPESFGNDFSGLINRKYPGSVGAGDDAARYAQGLVDGGYAEDPDYKNKIQSMANTVRQEPSSGRNAAPWSSCITKPEYIALTDEQKKAAQEEYFNTVVAPHVPHDKRSAAMEEFYTKNPIAKPIDTAFKPDSDQDPWYQQNALVGAGAGAIKGVSDILSNAEQLVGRGSNAFTNALPEFMGGGTNGNAIGNSLINDSNERLQAAQEGIAPYKKHSNLSTSIGEFAGGVGATLPVGGAIAGLARSVAPSLMATTRGVKLGNALSSGGFNLGGKASSSLGSKAADLATRAAGGGITSGVSGALIDPESAGTASALGAAFPVAGSGVVKAGSGLAKALGAGKIPESVSDLAMEAKRLGIDIPADRLTNSKPMNALASALEHTPFSGRQATVDQMQKQLNTAVSKTIGQDVGDINIAIRNAEKELGKKFEDTLSSTAVRVDEAFTEDMANVSAQVINELPAPQAKIINNQLKGIQESASGNGGLLDGKMAYNIKRTLDRIGKRNSPEAHYAIDLKYKLMDAMNRSMGEPAAAAFSKTREQYGNLLTLQKLASNGVDGNVSVAKLASMQNIRSPELKTIADIAAQFVRPRDSHHSASQRAAMGALGMHAVGGPMSMLPFVAAGKAGNSLLKSDTARNLMIKPNDPEVLASMLRYRTFPWGSKMIPALTDTNNPF